MKPSGCLRSPAAFFWGLCALAFALRWPGFASVDLWQDEANEIFIAQGALADVWGRILHSEMRPPLRYLFLNWWLHGGSSTAYLRLPSLVLSSAAVGVLYLGARRLLREDVARWGALMMAVASFPLSSAHFCRSYATDLFVCVLAFHAFARLSGSRARADRVYYVAAVALALVTSYYAGIVVGLMACMHALGVRRGAWSVRDLAAVYAAPALLAAPLLWLIADQWGHAQANRWHAGGTGALVFELYFNALAAGRIKDWTVSPPQFWLALACVAIASLGAWEIARSGSHVAVRTDARVVALWFVAPTLGLFAVSQLSLGVFTIRTMLVYAPAYYLLVAAGLSRFGRTAVPAAFVAIFAAVNVYAFQTTQDLRSITQGSQEVARLIAGSEHASQKVVHAQHFTYFPMRYYAPQLDHLIWQDGVPWNWGGEQVPREHRSARFGEVHDLEGFWFVRKRDHYHEPRGRWFAQLRAIANPWQGADERTYHFEADRRVMTDGVLLVHYRRVAGPGATNGAERLRAELQRQLDDGVFRDRADAAWLEETLQSLPAAGARAAADRRRGLRVPPTRRAP